MGSGETKTTISETTVKCHFGDCDKYPFPGHLNPVYIGNHPTAETLESVKEGLGSVKIVMDSADKIVKLNEDVNKTDELAAFGKVTKGIVSAAEGVSDAITIAHSSTWEEGLIDVVASRGVGYAISAGLAPFTAGGSFLVGLGIEFLGVAESIGREVAGAVKNNIKYSDASRQFQAAEQLALEEAEYGIALTASNRIAKSKEMPESVSYTNSPFYSPYINSPLHLEKQENLHLDNALRSWGIKDVPKSEKTISLEKQLAEAEQKNREYWEPRKLADSQFNEVHGVNNATTYEELRGWLSEHHTAAANHAMTNFVKDLGHSFVDQEDQIRKDLEQSRLDDLRDVARSRISEEIAANPGGTHSFARLDSLISVLHDTIESTQDDIPVLEKKYSGVSEELERVTAEKAPLLEAQFEQGAPIPIYSPIASKAAAEIDSLTRLRNDIKEEISSSRELIKEATAKVKELEDRRDEIKAENETEPFAPNTDSNNGFTAGEDSAELQTPAALTKEAAAAAQSDTAAHPVESLANPSTEESSSIFDISNIWSNVRVNNSGDNTGGWNIRLNGSKDPFDLSNFTGDYDFGSDLDLNGSSEKGSAGTGLDDIGSLVGKESAEVSAPSGLTTESTEENPLPFLISPVSGPICI